MHRSLYTAMHMQITGWVLLTCSTWRVLRVFLEIVLGHVTCADRLDAHYLPRMQRVEHISRCAGLQNIQTVSKLDKHFYTISVRRLFFAFTCFFYFVSQFVQHNVSFQLLFFSLHLFFFFILTLLNAQISLFFAGLLFLTSHHLATMLLRQFRQQFEHITFRERAILFCSSSFMRTNVNGMQLNRGLSILVNNTLESTKITAAIRICFASTAV